MERGDRGKEEEGSVVLIGGMVLDIHATPSMLANPKTTTPGKVDYMLGGVARNVAECLAKLGTKPFMISAVGLDIAGKMMLKHWKTAGLSVRGILKNDEIETAVVCNIFDAEGELSAGVASVRAIDKLLTPEWIQQFNFNVRCAPVLMADANLNAHALQAACQMAAEYDVPVWFEPVSVAKSTKITTVVKYITFASPNEDELIAMANALSCGEDISPIQSSSGDKLSVECLFRMLKPAIWVLLEKGIKILLVTIGPDGVLMCSRGKPNLERTDFRGSKTTGISEALYESVNSSCPANEFCSVSNSYRRPNLFVVHFPALSASVVRLTGCGDCFVGGTLASICAGLDITQSVAVGIAAAKASVESKINVPSEFCLTKIADDARTVYFGARAIFCESML